MKNRRRECVCRKWLKLLLFLVFSWFRNRSIEGWSEIFCKYSNI